MIAVDTSVAVPAVSGWHDAHDVCRRAADSAWIPAHAAVEAYSVLTRLPAPHRLAAPTASQVINGFFPTSRMLFPSADMLGDLVAACASVGVGGGAVYDALIGRTAKEHGATLLTLDRRAVQTYRRLGIEAELLG